MSLLGFLKGIAAFSSKSPETARAFLTSLQVSLKQSGIGFDNFKLVTIDGLEALQARIKGRVFSLTVLHGADDEGWHIVLRDGVRGDSKILGAMVFSAAEVEILYANPFQWAGAELDLRYWLKWELEKCESTAPPILWKYRDFSNYAS